MEDTGCNPMHTPLGVSIIEYSRTYFGVKCIGYKCPYPIQKFQKPGETVNKECLILLSGVVIFT